MSTTYPGENKLLVWTEEEKAARQQELIDKAEAFSPFTGRTDEFRHPTACPSGGFQLTDAAQTSLLRSSVTEILSVSENLPISPPVFVCVDGGTKDYERRF